MKVTHWIRCAVMCLIVASGGVAKSDDIVETAIKAEGFETLVTAVKAAGLVDTLQGKGPFTVFAPTDAAFAKLPKKTLRDLLKPENKKQLQAILTYHVVPAKVLAKQAISLESAPTALGQRLQVESDLGRLMINDSKVIVTDIECDNGVIHVIDQVLIPETKTIPAVAKSAGVFNTLLAAVTEAELAETLGSEGPFTVFAPTDEAFEKLPKGTVETLLKPENRKQLVSILTYHVVSGRVFADQAVAAAKAETLQGQSVTISVDAEGIKINESTVASADIQASNGVVHVIDQVLMPTILDPSATSKLLQEAVSKGARAFNHGDFHECYDVYNNVCMTIVEQGNSLPEEVGAVLEISLKRAKDDLSEKERAWVLRHGIDLAYFALNR